MDGDRGNRCWNELVRSLQNQPIAERHRRATISRNRRSVNVKRFAIRRPYTESGNDVLVARRSEDHGHFIVINGLPSGGFSQDAGDCRVFGNDHELSGMLIKEVSPTRFDVHRLQVRLEEFLPVEIMAVIDDYFDLRVETVDQVASPIIWRENGSVL